MKYVIDLDRLSSGVDYWRNAEYQPQKFGSQNSFFSMLEQMQGEGNDVCAYSKEAEQNMPEIVRWFEMNGIQNVPIVFKKDDDMVEVWDDKAMQIDPDSGEFIITQRLSENQIKKTTYAPIQIEVTSVDSEPCGFQDVDDLAGEFKKLRQQVAETDIKIFDRITKGPNTTKTIDTTIAQENTKLGAARQILARTDISATKRKQEEQKATEALNNILYLRLVRGGKQELDAIHVRLKKRLESALKLINTVEYPDEKSEKFRKRISILIAKPRITDTDRDEVDNIERTLVLEIKPFADNRKNALKELARLRADQTAMEASDQTGPALQKIKNTITDIQKSAQRDYVNVPDKIDTWKEVGIPKVSAGERLLSTEKATREILNRKVDDFLKLNQDEKLVRITGKTIDPDVAREINADQMASEIIDDIIQRPYQRDFFKRIKTATELQIAKDAVEKIDDIIKDAKISTITGGKLHETFFKRFMSGGEVATMDLAKKLGSRVDLDDVIDAALLNVTTGDKSVQDQRLEAATNAISEHMQKLENLIIKIDKFATTIDAATPEQLDAAKKAIGQRRAAFRGLTDKIKVFEAVPGQARWLGVLKSKLNQLKAQGFSTLEEAILKKEREEKRLVKQKAKGTAEQLGKKTAAQIQESEFRKQAGELTKDQEIALLQSEFGLPAALSKNIASTYSTQQIRDGKPFSDNPQYISLSSLGGNTILAKLKGKGLDLGLQLEKKKLIDQVNTSALPTAVKQRLLSSIESDPSSNLSIAKAAIRAAL